MNRAESQKVRILMVGYRKFSELINTVTPEFSVDAEVTIVESVANSNTEYHTLVTQHKPDVVASAGSNAAYLNATLSVPVVSQPVTDADIIEALAKARRIAPNVHLFSYKPENTPPKRLFTSLPDLIDIKFENHCYSTSAQAKEQLQLVIAEKSPGVVVGPSYTCHLAEQHDLPTILVYSKESAREMLRKAIEIGRNQPTEQHPDGPQEFVIRSNDMGCVAKMAQIYAQSPGTVLIQGESGTGKEHIAKEIHRLSDYKEGPLVALNCGSIPNELFESELFGYIEGAFTGSRRGGRIGLMEQANGGVLYLDEVSEMPLAQQAKLLRVLQEKRIRPVGGNREISIDFKLISATNRDLHDMVVSGHFRDDLYYRLNVLSLKLPPLRERPDDIEAITKYYLGYYGRQYTMNTDPEMIYTQVADAFQNYHWPGNVRELQNFVERLVINCSSHDTNKLKDGEIKQILLELFIPVPVQKDECKSLKEHEEFVIRRAMLRFDGNKGRVAKFLGISTTTLWRRLRAIESNMPSDAGKISTSGTSFN